MQAGVEALAGALRRGIGAICGAWRELGTIHLFESLRRSELAVDWRYSHSRGRTENKQLYITTSGYVFARRGIGRIGTNAWEDSRGFFASGELDQNNLCFSTGAADPLSELFEGGQQLLLVQVDWREGRHELSAFCSGQVCCCWNTWRRWGSAGSRRDPCSLVRFLTRVDVMLNGWRGAGANRSHSPHCERTGGSGNSA